MLSGQRGITLGMGRLLRHNLWGELTPHLSGGAHHQGLGWHVLCDHGACGHDGPRTNGDAVENNCSNAHQAPIGQRRAMNYSAMADGDLPTDQHRLAWITMQHDAVLNIAERSDPDCSHVAPGHGRGPEAAACGHHHITDDHGG